ncbi:hypothetical protein UCMB321_1988 [Pseudomonas batumici]|uniref:Uncharacterized protein n=1 Tax=Pseudomonas batumici TaxID=226910 RepID=A0A0C2EZE6_9PSED|nr:hypothetical protein UCMB321_1988 [Pseudomonas batumici]
MCHVVQKSLSESRCGDILTPSHKIKEPEVPGFQVCCGGARTGWCCDETGAVERSSQPRMDCFLIATIDLKAAGPFLRTRFPV